MAWLGAFIAFGIAIFRDEDEATVGCIKIAMV